MNKFKIGDSVRIMDNFYGSIGKFGTIVGITSMYYVVKVDNNKNVKAYSAHEICHYFRILKPEYLK